MIERVKRLWNNVGWFYGAQFFAASIFLAYMVIGELPSIAGWIGLLIAVSVFTIAFILREYLFEHFYLIRRLMNILAIAAIVTFLATGGFRSGLTIKVWQAWLIISGVSFYLGCYFWMLSDPRIGRVS